MVSDIRFDKPQHLTDEEAQRLMGMATGFTAYNGATDNQQLTVIGNGWDVNAVRIILSRSKLCSVHQKSNTSNEEAKHAILTTQQHLPPDKWQKSLWNLNQNSDNRTHHYFLCITQTSQLSHMVNKMPEDESLMHTIT